MSNENQKKLGINLALIAGVIGVGTLLGWGAYTVTGHPPVTVPQQVASAPVKKTQAPAVAVSAPVEPVIAEAQAPEPEQYVPTQAPLARQNFQDPAVQQQMAGRIQNWAQSNPQIQQYLQNNPQAQQLLQNLQNPQSPEAQQQIQTLMQNFRQRGQGGGFAGGGFGGGGNYGGGYGGPNGYADPNAGANQNAGIDPNGGPVN